MENINTILTFEYENLWEYMNNRSFGFSLCGIIIIFIDTYLPLLIHFPKQRCA